MATMTRAELQDKYDALLAEREEFTKRLIDIAGEAAAEHDLCEVLEHMLGRIGIELGNVRVKVTRTVTDTYMVPTIEAYRIGILGDTGYGSTEEVVADSLRWGSLDEYVVSDRHDDMDVTEVEIERLGV